jgi:hypothetical protein
MNTENPINMKNNILDLAKEYVKSNKAASFNNKKNGVYKEESNPYQVKGIIVIL